MSQRRRLAKFVKVAGGQLDGWKMGLSQAGMLPDVSMCLPSVVQRLWDQYQSEDSVSRRPVPGRPRATTPAEDRFLALSARRRRTTYCAAARCRPLSSIEEESPLLRCEIVFTMCRSVCKKTSCVRFLNGRQLANPLMLGKKHVS
ncbi:uncharacterized protein TNCV_679971 [Trichonephila clavipes]|nr:uncharacterized protein TNCV_679971 [Trichonephila clavipes]